MLNIGNNVIVRNDLSYDGDYGSNNVSRSMLQYCGKEAVIVDVAWGEYILDIDDGMWRWTGEMFEAGIANTDREER